MTKNKIDHIIPPIDRALIKAELTQDKFLRKTNKGNNLIYRVNAKNSPNLMQEIGRLRELTFTLAGGGTGQPVDIDHRDTAEIAYEQLIVYSPEDEEITGGYRYIDCSRAISADKNELSTSHYFNFSLDFVKNYLPFTLELGRSWVNPQFQPAVNPRKGLFALDNLWDGLGALVLLYPNMKYFFGKVTMYTSYNEEAKRAVLGFMKTYFPDPDQLVTPKFPLYTTVEQHEIVSLIKNLPFKDGLKVLQNYCRERGENIPPLINNYMQLSSTMKSFGTASNQDFGGVEETGILVTIDDILESKKNRHLEGFEF